MIRLLRQRPNDGFELTSFTAHEAPPYAILSHTWGDAEVTYNELVTGAGKDKAGYAKIRFCAETAARDELQYFWVDTCCIDKKSSAELSESINSMYRWYQQAVVCYALIEDWPSEVSWADLASVIPVDESENIESRESDDEESLESEDEESIESNECEKTGSKRAGTPQAHITKRARYQETTDGQPSGDMAQGCDPVGIGSGSDSRHLPAQSLASAQFKSPSYESMPLRWFTRGWTLQELIAPKRVEFFDSKQQSRGMKSDTMVVENLSRITGIAPGVLNDSSGAGLREICHGQRMSWAAYRETSRKEDIAYCLLGLFDVHMPLLYGEGMKAFTRLQEVILASSTDLSLLAWTQAPEVNQQYRGIFSHHPREFRSLGKCQLDFSQFSVEDEVIMTNKGARIETSLFQLAGPKGTSLLESELCFLSLGCCNEEYVLGIFLKKMKRVHVRGEPGRLASLNLCVRRTKARTIHLALDFDELSNLDYEMNMHTGLKVRLKAPKPYGLVAVESWPSGHYDALNDIFLVRHLNAFVGYLFIDVTEFVPQAPRDKSVARFMAVVTKTGHANITVTLLNERQAEDFKTHMELISAMDPHTAHKNLVSRLAHIWVDQEPLVAVQVPDTNSLLGVEGKIVDTKNVMVTESGETFMLKAVKISINLDNSTKTRE